MCGAPVAMRLREDGRGGEPAGGAPHHFDHATGAVICGHRADVQRDFRDGRGDVFGRGAETGAMVGVREIVIDRFRDADHAQLVVPLHRFLMDFVGSVLGVVPARVEKIADVVRLKNFEQPVHVFGGLLRRFY